MRVRACVCGYRWRSRGCVRACSARRRRRGSAARSPPPPAATRTRARTRAQTHKHTQSHTCSHAPPPSLLSSRTRPRSPSSHLARAPALPPLSPQEFAKQRRRNRGAETEAPKPRRQNRGAETRGAETEAPKTEAPKSRRQNRGAKTEPSQVRRQNPRRQKPRRQKRGAKAGRQKPKRQKRGAKSEAAPPGSGCWRRRRGTPRPPSNSAAVGRAAFSARDLARGFWRAGFS